MKTKLSIVSKSAREFTSLTGPLTILLVVSTVSIGLDQFLKLTASQMVVNYHLAWSVPLNVEYQWLLVLLSLSSVMLAVFHLVYGQFKYSAALFYGLLLGAGASNMLDRVLIGGVKDIWPIPIIGGYNNLADWLLLIAVFGISSILISEVNKSDEQLSAESLDQ